MSINEPAKKQRLYQLFPFLERAGDDFQRAFSDVAIVARFEPGAQICDERSRCSHLPLLLEGVARIFKSGENGKEITLYRIRPGESCVLTAACILSDLPFPATATVEQRLDVVLVPADFVRAWIGRDEAWREYLFGLVANRLASIIQVVEEVVFQRLDQRIACFLLREGKEGDRLRVIVATHQDLADELGTSREVVSRLLKAFEQRGCVRLSRGRIELLETTALERIASEGIETPSGA